MDNKSKMLKPSVSLNDTEGLDVVVLEKRLEGLRETQESVQGLSLWCQSNRKFSSTIIETWLKILRKSPVEKRLTLFYLANDVIQHAKRKSDSTVVNQWAFAVQKATPHVRSPSSVSAAITRIFKIWEERSIYTKDEIADLLALLNNVSGRDQTMSRKPETYTASQEKVSAFMPSVLISKTKQAFRLKSHLGVAFRSKRYVSADIEQVKSSIKDRNHGTDVISELNQLIEQLKASESKLLTEVEERRKIVETAEVAVIYYENIRGESLVVNSAYKTFTKRICTAQEKVDEKLQAFDRMECYSPIPSPPAMAPSPSPEDMLQSTNLTSAEYTPSGAPSHSTPVSANTPAAWATYSAMLRQQQVFQFQQQETQENTYKLSPPAPAPSSHSSYELYQQPPSNASDVSSIPLPPPSENNPPLPASSSGSIGAFYGNQGQDAGPTPPPPPQPPPLLPTEAVGYEYNYASQNSGEPLENIPPSYQVEAAPVLNPENNNLNSGFNQIYDINRINSASFDSTEYGVQVAALSGVPTQDNFKEAETSDNLNIGFSGSVNSSEFDPMQIFQNSLSAHRNNSQVQRQDTIGTGSEFNSFSKSEDTSNASYVFDSTAGIGGDNEHSFAIAGYNPGQSMSYGTFERSDRGFKNTFQRNNISDSRGRGSSNRGTTFQRGGSPRARSSFSYGSRAASKY